MSNRELRRRLQKMERKDLSETIASNFDTLYDRVGSLENRFNDLVGQFVALLDHLSKQKVLKVEKQTKGGITLPDGVVIDEPRA